MGEVAVIAAGAGVHGGYEHEGAGVFDGVFGTADGNLPVFERLAHHFEHLPVEFGQLVEEEYAVVCE